MKQAELRRILLAEDDDNDAELTIDALQSLRLANDVVRVKDGAEALDYLSRRNAYADRPPAHPARNVNAAWTLAPTPSCPSQVKPSRACRTRCSTTSRCPR